MEDTSKNFRNRQNLIRVRDEYFGQLEELFPRMNAKDAAKASDLLSTIRTFCDQIEGPVEGHYQGTPTQAITKYLERLGQSVRVPDLIDAVGAVYRGGGKEAKTGLKKALGRFASLSGAVWIKDPEWENTKDELLLRDGWVLLRDWNESYIHDESKITPENLTDAL